MKIRGLYIFLMFFTSIDVFALPNKIPPEYESRYQYLYSQEVDSLSNDVKRFDKAKLFKRGRLNILYLHGDGFEMAYQHGRLLKSEINQGALVTLSEILTNTIYNTMGERGFVAEVAQRYAEGRLEEMFNATSKLEGAQPQLYFSQAYGLAAGSGMPLDKIFRAAFSPETLQVLLAETADTYNGFWPKGMGAGAGQCSTFVAIDKTSGDRDALMIGRNTDYPLNGVYDQFPTVIYFDPTDGGQKFMTVATAGMHNAGVVGLNESGIFLSTHTVPVSVASAQGTVSFFVGQRVVRMARNLDEAIAIFRGFRPAAGWTFLIASAKEKRAISIEYNYTGMAIREQTGPYHVQTNHYFDPKMNKVYLHINQAVDEDSQARYSRIDDLLKVNSGRVDVKEAMAILGDKVEPVLNIQQAMPNTIAAMVNMTSMVYQPSKSLVYVADGTAPVSRGRYVALPSPDQFDPNRFGQQPFVAIGSNEHRLDAAMDRAEQYFIRAKMEYEYHNDSKAAYSWALRALAEVPDSSSYLFVSAMLALKAGLTVDAERLLVRLESHATDAHRRRLALFYHGRILAGARNAAKALEYFSAVEQDSRADQKLRDAARVAAKRTQDVPAYRINRNRLRIMMQQADMMSYDERF